MAQFPDTRDPFATPAQDFQITRFGGHASGGSTPGQTFLHVATAGAVGKPSILVLDAVDPTTGAITSNFIWCDSSGNLRISTTRPTLPETNGTKVGSQ